MGDYTYLIGLVVLGMIIAGISFFFIYKERKAQHVSEHGHQRTALPAQR